MAEGTSFIHNQLLDDVESVIVDGKRVHLSYQRVIAEVERRAGKDAAGLFAEPVEGRDPETGGLSVAWHWMRGGEPQSVVDLDAVAREAAIARLREHVRKLAPLLADPVVGPILASWFNIRSRKDIVRIGREPVILNWGMLPKEVARDPSGRRMHFADTVGTLAPWLPSPPFKGSEFASYTSARQREFMASEDQAKAPPQTQSEPLRPVSMIAHGGPLRYLPVQLRSPVIATVIAGGVLGILSLPGVLRNPDTRVDQAALDRQFEEERQRNDALEERLKQLRDAASKHQCRAADGAEPLRPIVAPPAQRVQVDVPGARDATARRTNLADLIDKSTVLVFSVSRGSLGNGSGFVINEKQIVTNYHVIDEVRRSGGKVLVYNRVWGNDPIPARIVAETAGADSADGDFAVLEIDSVQGHLPVALGFGAQRIEDVIAAGFPAYLSKSDEGFRRLVSGEGGAAVDPYVLSGIVSSMHQQAGTAREVVGHTAQIAEGSSGGPLFNLCGWVIGVNTFGVLDTHRGTSGAQITRAAPYALSARMLGTFLRSKNISFKAEERQCPGAAATPDPPAGPGQPAIPPAATAGQPTTAPGQAKK